MRKVNSVRYDQVNAMLLNEFLKEHRRVEEQDGRLHEQARRIGEQEATIKRLQNEVENIASRFDESER